MLQDLVGGTAYEGLQFVESGRNCSPPGYRSLQPDEVLRLEHTFNSSPRWERVLVAEHFAGIGRIRGCHFDGNIILNSFEDSVSVGDGLDLPSGLINSNFKGFCFLGANCLVINTAIVNNVVMGNRVCVVDCGVITCDGSSSFGNGEVVMLGPESGGGRRVSMFLGVTYGEVCRAAMDRRAHTCSLTDERARRVSSDMAIQVSTFGNEVRLLRCGIIKNAKLGSFCTVSSSTVESCTIASSAEYPAVIDERSVLHTCILSGSNNVNGPCVVRQSLLMEEASVSTGANISNCILGPDCSVAGAECISSIIGPFVGLHHASLVISCCWPTGRGNVAYGAKAANHTGRVNDQECLSGEGCFYGLDVQLKYPFNTICAPYSLFAAGTTCLPQKLTFPFSLVASADIAALSADALNIRLSPALNIIRPGWVIYDSPYIMERAFLKFKSRRKAVSYSTDHPVWRPWIVRLMFSARKRLRRIALDTQTRDCSPHYIYSEKDDPGLGKNIMSEAGRSLGEAAYSSALRKYALGAVFAALMNVVSLGHSVESFLQNLRDKVVAMSAAQQYYPFNLSDEDLFLADLDELYPSVTYNAGGPDTCRTKENVQVLNVESVMYLILSEEYDTSMMADLKGWAKEMMNDLVSENKLHIDRVLQCRDRDLLRGERIIPDYAAVQGLTRSEMSTFSYLESDPTVRSAFERAKSLESEIETLKLALSAEL